MASIIKIFTVHNKLYNEGYEHSSNYWYYGLIRYEYKASKVKGDGNCLLYSLLNWDEKNSNILGLANPAHKNLRMKVKKYIRDNLQTPISNEFSTFENFFPNLILIQKSHLKPMIKKKYI